MSMPSPIRPPRPGSSWRFAGALPTVGAFALVVLLLLLSACRPSCGAAVVGRWQCGIFPVVVYQDGVASVLGMKASWEGTARDAIRLEYAEKGETVLGELEVLSDPSETPRKAKLTAAGLGFECTEVQE